jgi:hypothetical protein
MGRQQADSQACVATFAGALPPVLKGTALHLAERRGVNGAWSMGSSVSIAIAGIRVELEGGAVGRFSPDFARRPDPKWN